MASETRLQPAPRSSTPARGPWRAASAGVASGRVIRPGSSVKPASSSARSSTRRAASLMPPQDDRSAGATDLLRAAGYGISRTITRFVAPGVPVCRPEVSTTRAPDGSPAQSRAFSSAVSIISSTDSAVSMVVG